MKNMKKMFLLVVYTVCLLFVTQSVYAATINLLQNGDFEANGGSLAGWNTYGDITLIMESDGNHAARLGGTTGGGIMSQYFNIGDDYLNQTLSVTYDFNFYDNNPYKFDVFATVIKDSEGSIIETPILLASYDTSLWGNYSGVFTDLLDPQLSAGTYALKFVSTEATSWNMDAYVDIDNVSLTAVVPEPSILMLLGSTLIGIAVLGRKAHRMFM